MRFVFMSILYYFLLSQKSFILICLSDFAEPSISSIVKDYCSNLALCYDIFLPSSISDSLYELKYSISGQPFVKNTLIPALEKHFLTDKWKGIHPNKPLVLRFHGPIGVGKTFVADHLMKSNYFRNKLFFSLSELSEETSFDVYKKKIEWKIEFSLSNCKRSIFVFDDVSAVPPDFFENLPPFKKYHPQAKRPNFNESLFIFISQTDSDAITETTAMFINDGRSRDSLEISEFLTSMKNQFFSGGSFIKSVWDKVISYWDKDSNSQGVIDLYIPFLPLEPTHIKKCIENEVGAAKLKSNKNMLEKIIVYHPLIWHLIFNGPGKNQLCPENRIRTNYSNAFKKEPALNVLYAIHCTPDNKFCPYGCKLVHAKTSIVLENRDEF